MPGRFDRTIGSDTGGPDCCRSALSTSLTPFRMRARVELPSRAARDFRRRYIASGISTVVRMRPLCHIYGTIVAADAVLRPLAATLENRLRLGRRSFESLSPPTARTSHPLDSRPRNSLRRALYANGCPADRRLVVHRSPIGARAPVLRRTQTIPFCSGTKWRRRPDLSGSGGLADLAGSCIPVDRGFVEQPCRDTACACCVSTASMASAYSFPIVPAPATARANTPPKGPSPTAATNISASTMSGTPRSRFSNSRVVW